MRPIWKGTISFGLVNIPIALGIATQRSDPKFRTLDAESKQPIRQQLFSPARGEVIERDQTVKGYEVSKDSFVVITDEELESVAVERRKTIDVVEFIDADGVDPVYYDRSYYVAPQDGAEKPYALLLEAMKKTGKVGVGSLVLSSREHLVVLRPAGDALVIELLFYPEDVRSKEEIEENVREAKVTKKELDMALQLVDSLAKPFDPEEFQNEHKREVMALIEKKIAGEEIEMAPEAPEPAPVPDLMSALKASLEEAKGEKEPARARSSRDGAAKKSTRRKAASRDGAGKKKGGSRSRGKAASRGG